MESHELRGENLATVFVLQIEDFLYIYLVLAKIHLHVTINLGFNLRKANFLGIYFLFSPLFWALTRYLFKVLLGDGVIVFHLRWLHLGVLFALIVVQNILVVDAKVK